jgi:radical SAM protein with 4Fe4S-binding SPASM domain
MRDAINFLGKLTFRKVLNFLLVRTSLAVSNLFKIPVVWGKPWFISMETTSVCNLGCPQCPTGQGDIERDRKFMDLGEYRHLLEEISETTLILSLYFQGEPLMQEDFTEFVRLASQKNIYTQTSTSGQLLTEEVCRGLVSAGLDRIIVSLDGTDPDTYRAYRRGGDLNKVLEGIRNLVRIRRQAGSRKPFLIVQFLVFKNNLGQVSGVRDLSRRLGADRTWIKSAQLEYPQAADEWIPEDPGYSRYEKKDPGEWRLRGRLKNRCSRLWQTTVITSDGFVVPCCFDKRAVFRMGNTGEKSLAQTWKNTSYREFRKRVLSARDSVAICTNCTEGIGRVYR